MSDSRRRLERIKDAVIVVLFIMTILLLYLVWQGSPRKISFSGIFNFISPGAVLPSAEDFIKPDFVVYGYGDAAFSAEIQDASSIYDGLLSLVKANSGKYPVGVSEISAEQKAQMMNEFKSLRLVFPKDIPFLEYCKRNGIESQPGYDSVQFINEVIISEAAPESIFVVSGDTCYRFLPDGMQEDIAGHYLDGLKSQEPIFYAAGNILGGENPTLLPLHFSSELARSSWNSEAQYDPGGTAKEMAVAIFGENFDFVRRITDNFGNLTYMYGYGQKTLSCSAEGSYEYRMTPSTGADPGFYGSLESAISFVAGHGGWGDERRASGYLLSHASVEGSGREKIYNFEFSQTAEGVRIYSEAGPAIKLRLCAGEVFYYNRRAGIASAKFSQEREAVDAANVLAGNCNLMYNILSGELLVPSSDKAFSYVVDRLERVSVGYVLSGGTLEPAWVMGLEGGNIFFFGLYDAEPLGFTR